MYYILRSCCQNRSLFQWNICAAVSKEISTCKYHAVTNVTYTLENKNKTFKILNKHLLGKRKWFSLNNDYKSNLNNTKSEFDRSPARFREFCTVGQTPLNVDQYMECSDENTRLDLVNDMLITYEFITEEEENCILNEIEPYMKRLRYESSHWDDAIHGYRETERKVWSEKNKAIIQRVRDVAFPAGTPQLAYVHILDLKKDGYIKPHVDAVKFCGNTVAGICLLSPAIMRLVHNEDKTRYADILLKRRCLYIMKNVARYDYTHEVLKEEDSTFRGRKIQKDRRISVICRNEP